MLYSEQIAGESFCPISCNTPLFTFEILNEIRPGGDNILFSECIFNADKNKGSLNINNSNNIIFKKCTFFSGLEKCVEMSRARDILFNECIFNLNGNRQISINCASNSIKFFGCNFLHTGKSGEQAMILGPWVEEDKVWRPPVSGISFERCSFAEGLLPYLAVRSIKPNIEGKSVSNFIVDLVWYLARKILRKKPEVDYNIYEHEYL
jgi:hypothetical protein